MDNPHSLEPRSEIDDTSGFTLVELMIVVLIIGVLTAAAIPRFDIATWKTKEKEAEVALRHIYSMQSIFWMERGAFASSVAELQAVGYEPSMLTYFEPITDAHMPSDACLVATEPTVPGKRINFDTGIIADC